MDYVKWSVHNAWEDYLEGDCQLRIAQMERLREHKYSAVDISWLDEYCMKRFWEYVVQFYPIWIAPNVITMLGLFINLLTVLILACFSYDAKIAASSWAYFQAALGMFLYQTLDATDGKQARRTGTSSPLGELFDHGCDAMSQVLVTLNICYAMLLGQERYVVLFVTVSSVVLFYCAHWSTYCTGRLKFAKQVLIFIFGVFGELPQVIFCFYRFDVTEAQMTILVILLITSIFGTGFWTEQLVHISLKYVAIFISFLMCISQIGDYLVDVVTGGVGKNGSTVADTSVLSPLIPLLMMITPFCMIYSKSVTAVYDDHITLFVFCLGAVSTKATMRLILAHMSRSELAMWDWIYLSPLMMMLNQYYDMPLNEFYLLVCATASFFFVLIFLMIYAYASLSLYCVMVIRQLCAHLRVHCFSVKPLNESLEKLME
uniref:CDP-alcohol phosphatidyltransferase n=1 Tax=Onchocerca volvulus TaxID=6282 RepID=A0A8R1XX12_ONCVO